MLLGFLQPHSYSVQTLSLFGPVILFHARWIVQMAVLFGGVSLELGWEPHRLPCKAARWVSQAVIRFTRGPLVSLDLHVDTVTHSSNQSIYSFLCFMILPKQ